MKYLLKTVTDVFIEKKLNINEIFLKLIYNVIIKSLNI